MTQKVPYAMVEDTAFTDIASAATINLDTAAGSMGRVTGTVTITAVTLSANKLVWVQFTGILTLTNGGALALPSAANIITAAGDWALFGVINGVVTCLFYSRATGASVAPIIGAVVATSNTQTGAVASGTTLVPLDDTIPQITEGDQYMTLAYQASSATNFLKVEVVIVLAHSIASVAMIAALFKDAVANALAAAVHYTAAAAGNPATIKFSYIAAAGTTSPITFRVRAGSSTAGTTTFNGIAAGRIFGGVMASSIHITEYKI